MTDPLAGELACLSAAALWAVSVTLFRGPIAEHGARTVNLAKCVLAALLQLVTVAALGLLRPLADATSGDLALVAVSGVVGLTLGDTALFGAVARIGVHRTLLLQTLAPVFAAAIAAAWQGELPTPRQAAGAAVILLGVALVVAPRRDGAAHSGVVAALKPLAGPVTAGWASAGVLLGVGAAFGQGSGIVLAKAGMESVPVLAASFLRLAAAALGLVAIGVASGRLGRAARLARSPAALKRVVPATFLGTYLALFLMMAGVALAPAAIAAVLLSMSPVFSLVIEAVQDRRAVTPRAVAGTLLAMVGVAILTSA